MKSKASGEPSNGNTILGNGGFGRFARSASSLAGRPATFMMSLFLIIAWAVTGPMFDFNETWQLAVNTGTTIVTFLMVFLIQNSQNRDGIALQIKLDEIIRSIKGAQNSLLVLEELSEEELEAFRQDYEKLASKARSCKTGQRRATSK